LSYAPDCFTNQADFGGSKLRVQRRHCNICGAAGVRNRAAAGL